MTEEAKVEPCPFCGGEALLNVPASGGTPFVMCKSCYGAGKPAHPLEAIIAWNRRTHPDLKAERDALVGLARRLPEHVDLIKRKCRKLSAVEWQLIYDDLLAAAAALRALQSGAAGEVGK